MKEKIDKYAIELIGINKSFGNVKANKNVSLNVEHGKILGIVGENGAGKSTLMSILYGFYSADEGQIKVNGEKANIHHTHDAIKLGIGMVHQHFMLVENFTVLENVLLGAQGNPLLYSAENDARTELLRLEEEYELSVDPDAKIEELPVGLQQRVEILKALYRGAEVLILDEPTGVLTPTEANHLFRILKQLKKQGKTIILITHKLREIMDATDNVCVMRQGEIVAQRKTDETNMAELAQMMVGRRVLLEVDKSPAQPKEIRLEVKNISVRDNRGVEKLKEVSFDVKSGEIVAIAGVAGNGQSELLHALCGMMPFTGQALIDGKELKQCKEGIAHVPEDRHNEGLVMPFSAKENGILGVQTNEQFNKSGFLKINEIKKNMESKIDKYDIRPNDSRLKVANFSGGNQQKIVLAREFEQDPNLLLIGQPTRGVDVGAIEFIYKQIIEMRDKGKAILLVSVELDEIHSLADRILVMFDGKIVGECQPDASDNEIGMLMAGATV